MSYYDDLGNGKFRLCVKDPTKVGRKRLSKSITVPPEIYRSETKTKKYLDLALAKYEEEVESGKLIRKEKISKISFAEFIPIWKNGCANETMGSYTRKNVMEIINSRLLPVFDDTRMDQIHTIHLVTFFAGLTRKDGKPLATNTKLNVYKAAKSIFDAATDWKTIAVNPMDGVKRPSAGKEEKKKLRKTKRAYTREETRIIIDALLNKLELSWSLYYIGAILGAFRRGEMLAIEWPEVDFEAGGFYINKQITFDEEGNKTEGELKTESSEGFVPMPRWYMERLKNYYRTWLKEKLQCKEWKGGDKQYIFHSGNGEMYYPNTPSLTWRRFLKRTGLPHVRLHDLRHTTAMLLREKNVQTKTIQERLRHAKSTTTENMYMHESELVSRDAADQLEDLDPKTATRSATRRLK